MKYAFLKAFVVAACAVPSAAQMQAASPDADQVKNSPEPAVPGPSAASARPGARLAEAMARIDSNKDGAISRAEWTAAGRRDRGFELFDGDSDGKLTIEEIRSGLSKLRARSGRSR